MLTTQLIPIKYILLKKRYTKTIFFLNHMVLKVIISNEAYANLQYQLINYIHTHTHTYQTILYLNYDLKFITIFSILLIAIKLAVTSASMDISQRPKHD